MDDHHWMYARQYVVYVIFLKIREIDIYWKLIFRLGINLIIIIIWFEFYILYFMIIIYIALFVKLLAISFPRHNI